MMMQPEAVANGESHFQMRLWECKPRVAPSARHAVALLARCCSRDFSANVSPPRVGLLREFPCVAAVFASRVPGRFFVMLSPPHCMHTVAAGK
jgi:hypothetical protein